MRLLRILLLASATVLAGCDVFLGEPAKITTVTIEPGELTVVEGDWLPIKAVVRDSRGNEMPDAAVTLVTRDWGIANVDRRESPGVFAYGPGTTILEAHAADKVGTATVIVTPGVVKSISVSPNRFVVIPGQPTQLYVQAKDERGNTLRNRTATFSSATNNIATVTPYGSVASIAPGFATIVVTIDGVSANVPLRVMPTTASFEYYKRGGTNTAGTAKLTFDPGNVSSGTLAIDGKSLRMYASVNYDAGVTCMYSQGTNTGADAIGRCAFDPYPQTLRLCTPLNGILYPGQLQYVLLPVGDSSRVPATGSALLSAVQSYTKFEGINVHSGCASAGTPGEMPPRWVRNAPGTDFFFWPDLLGVHPAASVAALLDGAVIYSAPGAGVDFTKYVAIRVGAAVFEVWH